MWTEGPFHINTDAELHGRVDGIRIDALNRAYFLAINGSGIPDSYKLNRIRDILSDAFTEIQRIENE